MSRTVNTCGQEWAYRVPDGHSKIQQLRVKITFFFFLAKTTLGLVQNGHMKGNSGYSTNATRVPCAEGPSRAL